MPIFHSAVTEQEVNDKFLTHLLILNEKTDFLAALSEKQGKPKTVQDVEPGLIKLCAKAAQKVKTYLIQKIAEMKKQQNPQHTKQHVLLRNKFFQEFLEKHNFDAAIEVCYSNCITLVIGSQCLC